VEDDARRDDDGRSARTEQRRETRLNEAAEQEFLREAATPASARQRNAPFGLIRNERRISTGITADAILRDSLWTPYGMGSRDEQGGGKVP
jgi:hypothetical protein